MSATGGQMPQTSTVKYASFGQRFAAILIDTIILLLLQWILGGVLGYLIGQSMADDYANGYVTLEDVTQKATAWAWIVGSVVSWLYFSLFESSEKQATPGKMAVGLVVTDLSGDRLGFGQATGRHFSKIISSITLFIGYLAPLWTQKKQAFHDIISGCLVIDGAPRASQAEHKYPAGERTENLNDEALYLAATEEFAGLSRQAGLWAKVLALHDGDEEKAKFSYIRERVAQMLVAPSGEVKREVGLSHPSESKLSDPQSGQDSEEYFGEQGESYRLPDEKAAADFSSKHGVKLSSAQRDEVRISSENSGVVRQGEELSLKERLARLDAAIKVAKDGKR